MLIRIASLLFFTLWLLTIQSAHSRPYHGDLFAFYQPDGQEISVRLFGDEFYAVIESPEGYTLTKDPTSGYYCFATVAADGISFLSTGIKAGEPLPPDLHLKKNLRLSPRAMQEKSAAAREKMGVDAKGRLLPPQHLRFHPQDFGYEHWLPELEQEARTLELVPQSAQPAPPSTPTTQTRIGLVLLARFPDRPGDVTISQAQVDAYANDPSYTEFNNATSVYGYFKIQSNGKLAYNCIVTAYFTAAHDRAYYTDSSIAYGTRAKELINEGLAVLKAKGFDFTKADGNNDGVLDGVNLFYAGSRINNWSEGLWPHKLSSFWSGLSGTGVSNFFQYQISEIGSSLSLGTFCHENGHMICNFPDLYSYDNNAADIGGYSLMSTSGSTHPPNVDAYLKTHAGWSTVIDIDSATHQRGALEVDQNTFYRYKNPNDPREYFLLSLRTDSGYEGTYGGATSAANPADGLVIWHAREHGSNTRSSIFSSESSPDYSTPYELMVVEANPTLATTPWYNKPAPGSNDAYHLGNATEASDFTIPALKFWDTSSGRTTSSGMHVHSISARGDLVSFTLGKGVVTGPPTIALTAAALTPTCDYATDAPSQTFTLFNSGGNTLNYTLSDDASWLAVSPASGSTTTGARRLTATYASSELEPGTYHAALTITDDTATNSPLTLPVTLTIHPRATIDLSLTDLQQRVQAEQQGTASFTLSNNGGGTLFYTLSLSADWLLLSKNSGTIATEDDEITVTFDATNLAEGIYRDTIVIQSSSADTAPQTINVTLIVTGPIVLLNPDGGETLWRGNQQSIRWVTDATITGKVKIDLYQGGIWQTTLAVATDNDGLYNWTIPDDQTLGDDYTIRISSINEPLLTTESYVPFSLNPLPPLVTIPYHEDFQNSLGDWHQLKNDDFDWTRNFGSTPSQSTGPSSAADGLWYLYTNSAHPNNPGKSAILEAHVDLRSTTAPIMTFFTHMYGASMGELQLRASSDQDNWTTLFSRKGDQGDMWNPAHADLSSLAGKAIVLQFIGLTGDDSTSDMALDMFTISESSKTLIYSSNRFIKSSKGDGSIANGITITLRGDTFTPNAVSGGYITVENIPDGLTAHFIRKSPSQITFRLTGYAIHHTLEDSFQNLIVHFADEAFTSGNASAITSSTQALQVSFTENSETTLYPLEIIRTGNGSGWIRSEPAGIDCRIDCSASFANNTRVILSVTTERGSAFHGWSGDPDCSDGIVTLDSAKSCRATFQKSSSLLLLSLPTILLNQVR